MSKITLFNPGNTAVVYSEDGRIVAGAERVEVQELDATGQRAVERGYLVNETREVPEKSENEPEEAPKSRRSRKPSEESGGESSEAKGD